MLATFIVAIMYDGFEDVIYGYNTKRVTLEAHVVGIGSDLKSSYVPCLSLAHHCPLSW